MNTISLSLRLLRENLESIKKYDLSLFQAINHLVEECVDLVNDLDENSTIAVTTLNDLINYDKIETSTFKIERSEVDIFSVVQKTVGQLTLHAKEKGVNLTLTQSDQNLLDSPGRLRVFGDSMKLAQVIRNLVSNALKFTPQNGNVTVSGESIQFFFIFTICSFLQPIF